MGFVSALIAAIGIGQQASAVKSAGKAKRSAGVQAREEQARQETAASKLEVESKEKARETIRGKRKSLIRSKTTRTGAQGAKLGLGDVSRKELLGS